MARLPIGCLEIHIDQSIAKMRLTSEDTIQHSVSRCFLSLFIFLVLYFFHVISSIPTDAAVSPQVIILIHAMR